MYKLTPTKQENEKQKTKERAERRKNEREEKEKAGKKAQCDKKEKKKEDSEKREKESERRKRNKQCEQTTTKKYDIKIMRIPKRKQTSTPSSQEEKRPQGGVLVSDRAQTQTLKLLLFTPLFISIVAFICY